MGRPARLDRIAFGDEPFVTTRDIHEYRAIRHFGLFGHRFFNYGGEVTIWDRRAYGGAESF